MAETKSIASPLAALVANAKATLPANTGASAKAIRRRNRGEIRVVLADVSSSMAESAGAVRKIDVLSGALTTVPPTVAIVAFSSFATDIAAGSPLPSPAGSTALHLALTHIASRDPSHVLVISDGHPDDERAALAAADRLDAKIDVIYCGPDHDRAGLAFMQRLARGGGKVHRRSFRHEPEKIAQTVRMLALPAK